MALSYEELRGIHDGPKELLARIEGACVDLAWDIIAVEAAGAPRDLRLPWAQKTLNESVVGSAGIMAKAMLWHMLIASKGAADEAALRAATDPAILAEVENYVTKIYGPPT